MEFVGESTAEELFVGEGQGVFMGVDQTVEIMRRLLLEALILSAPLLIAAALISLLVSLIQTLTSVQEQTLTAVPRLVVVFSVAMITLPWTVQRMVSFTVHLWSNLSRYLG
jgi:flagellar biosynthetic protein FliQ